MPTLPKKSSVCYTVGLQKSPPLPSETCPRCGAQGPHVQAPGTGPHYRRLDCRVCGLLVRWLPYPDEVTRLRERLNDAKECFRAQRARITELERKNHEYAARIDQLERDLHVAMSSLTQLRLELAELCAQNSKLLSAPTWPTTLCL